MDSIEINQLTLQALKQAMQQEGESRLVSAGKSKPGLIGGNATRERKEAEAQCLDENLDLFSVREESEKKGKKHVTVHFVSITSQGVITVLNHLSGSELDQARTECAPSIRTLVDAVLPEVIGAKLTRVNEGISKYIHQRRELFALIQKTAEASAQQEAQLQEQAAQLSRLQSLVALPEEREPERKQEATVEPANVEMKERLTARTEEQLDFQRDICEELIYAWQDADESTREALIRVMINNGLEPVEEVGQEVGFNGNRHITSSPIDVGAIAVVTEPGWLLTTRRGEYLIARARVQPKQSAHQEKLENVRND